MKLNLMIFLLLIISVKIYALDPLLPPSVNFDLTAWKVQTLDANLKVVYILESDLTYGYFSNYFYSNAIDGSLVFILKQVIIYRIIMWQSTTQQFLLGKVSFIKSRWRNCQQMFQL